MYYCFGIFGVKSQQDDKSLINHIVSVQISGTTN
jgi:hypothetical protein